MFSFKIYKKEGKQLGSNTSFFNDIINFFKDNYMLG